VSEKEDFESLQAISDELEAINNISHPPNVGIEEVLKVDRLVEQAIPILETLNLERQLDSIKEFIRKRNAGVETPPWVWIMEMFLEINSAYTSYKARLARFKKANTQADGAANPTTHKNNYVSDIRIAELASLKNPDFDFSKLAELCREINACHLNSCHIAVAALVRTIANHVPPVFGQKNIEAVAANYPFGRSVKSSIATLATSLKDIADNHLHDQIKKNVVLPSEAQVNFSRELDVLLGEIVRVAKGG
jgi:hypothetical protein